jgi:hypothetical protein
VDDAADGCGADLRTTQELIRMRVTTGPRKGVATLVAAAALALNVATLVFATVGGAASHDDPATIVTSPTDATTQDTGLVNPWAAGDAAVLQALAKLGRASLNSCPRPDQREPCGLLAGDPPSTTTPAQGEAIRPHDTGASSGDVGS